MADLDFSGKNVLVVGGSSGIGNGIAHAFRARGAKVYVWGTRPSAKDYDGVKGSDLKGLEYAQVNVSEQAAVEAWQPPFEKLDVLVLAQGIVLYKRAEFEMSGFRKVVEVNLNSLMTCSGKFRDMLAKAKGALIIISSTAGFHATKGNPAYGASKAGAVGLTRTLGEAWAPDGIRVNGVAPGFVETKITEVTFSNPKRREATLQAIPSGRFGTPEDIAGATLFLASPLSSYIYGQTLIVDGGLILS
ncbi:MAG: SDR family oxidoreductase [Nevskia sp.]|nr:SDR family oxidoreductase [Nevskia sp.]